MTKTLTGLFDLYADAARAVRDLEAAGVPHRDISLVANNAHGDHAGSKTDPTAAADDAGKGAGIGAAVGGVGGLLAGLGLLAIPGLGPVVAVGWLASTAVGAIAGGAVGAATGGLVGALTHEGVSDEEANVYAEGVRRGGTLVTAKVADDLVPTARTILAEDRGAADIRGRREGYLQSGWVRFDPSAPAYTIDEIDAERARYRRL